MTPANHLVVENRKYVWDGVVYAQQDEASRAAEAYRSSGFDVRVVTDRGEWFVFTRRQAASDPAKS